MPDREWLIGCPLIVTPGFSSGADLRKERRPMKLSSCVDVIAATSLCYVNSIRFLFASAIECNSQANPDLAVLRRMHA